MMLKVKTNFAINCFYHYNLIVDLLMSIRAQMRFFYLITPRKAVMPLRHKVTGVLNNKKKKEKHY